jgi:hypothetical protein
MNMIPTSAVGGQGPHVENVNTLHLSEDFETFETGCLFEIGWHGTRLSTRWEKIRLGLDLCMTAMSVAAVLPVLSGADIAPGAENHTVKGQHLSTLLARLRIQLISSYPRCQSNASRVGPFAAAFEASSRDPTVVV